MSARKASPKRTEQSAPSPSATDQQMTGRQPPSAQATSAEPSTTQVQRFLAELLGTLLLVLFHGGASASLRLFAHSAHVAPSPQSIAFLALIDGFSLFMIIMIIGKISGVLINPAVTIGLAIRGRFPRNEVPVYLGAQFVGATLGAAAILLTFGHDALTIGRLGAVQLAPGVSIWQGMIVEAIGAFVLVLTISATAEDPRSPSGWAAFAIGMALFAIVMLFESVTGAPVNPARAFGPDFLDALLNVPVKWGDYALCYLLAPIVGASLATTLYRYLANQPEKKPDPEPG